MREDKWTKRKPGNHNIQYNWSEIMERVSDEIEFSLQVEGKASAIRKDPPDKGKKGKKEVVEYIVESEKELEKKKGMINRWYQQK